MHWLQDNIPIVSYVENNLITEEKLDWVGLTSFLLFTVSRKKY